MYLGVIIFGMLLGEVQNAIGTLYEYHRYANLNLCAKLN